MAKAQPYPPPLALPCTPGKRCPIPAVAPVVLASLRSVQTGETREEWLVRNFTPHDARSYPWSLNDLGMQIDWVWGFPAVLQPPARSRRLRGWWAPGPLCVIARARCSCRPAKMAVPCTPQMSWPTQPGRPSLPGAWWTGDVTSGGLLAWRHRQGGAQPLLALTRARRRQAPAAGLAVLIFAEPCLPSPPAFIPGAMRPPSRMAEERATGRQEAPQAQAASPAASGRLSFARRAPESPPRS